MAWASLPAPPFARRANQRGGDIHRPLGLFYLNDCELAFDGFGDELDLLAC